MDPSKFSNGKLGRVERATLERQLKSEGYDVVYVQEDAPGLTYDTHTHDTRTAHIVLEGSMDLTVLGQVHYLGPGDRFDIPMGVPHSAVVGPKGCTYLVGEK